MLDVVRDLARESGGSRALRAVAADSSLEREVGLGSLERVELLVRLEKAFGRPLDDRFLQIDSPSALAKALLEEAGTKPLRLPGRGEALRAAQEVQARTVHESLFRHAQAEPERPTVFLREADDDETTLTYGRLWRDAARVAGGLRDRGVVRGDTVALMLPTGLDFLRTFPGILAAGAVGVPIYPPLRLDRLEEYAARQSAILADAGVKVLVTIPRAMPIAALLRPAVKTLREVTTADELASLGAVVPGPEGALSDPAFIQYTSGSTGSPKGVLLTHENLMANIRAIGAGLRGPPHRRGRELAAALPRHGAHRLLALLPPPGPAPRPPEPDRLPRPSRALALGDPPAPRDPHRRPELRLRARARARCRRRRSRAWTSRPGDAR